MSNFHGIRDEVIASMIRVLNGPRRRYFVSVGSGCGSFELRLSTLLGITIYCIDPKVRSHGYNEPDEKYHIEPHYPIVEDFLKDHPDAVSNTTLFLGWPTPNDSKYDFEAIGQLKPTDVIIVYAACGAAGSKYLLRWLYDIVDRGNIDEYLDESGKPTDNILDDWSNYTKDDEALGNIGYSWDDAEESSYYISNFPGMYNVIGSFAWNKISTGIAYRAALLSKNKREDFDPKLLDVMDDKTCRTDEEDDRHEYTYDVNEPSFSSACAIC